MAMWTTNEVDALVRAGLEAVASCRKVDDTSVATPVSPSAKALRPVTSRPGSRHSGTRLFIESAESSRFFLRCVKENMRRSSV